MTDGSFPALYTSHPTLFSIEKDLLYWDTLNFMEDTVMIPVNPGDPSEDSFVEVVVPVASAQDMGIIGIDAMLDLGQ